MAKNPSAQTLGALGGKARAAKMSKKARKAEAKQMAKARWAKHPACVCSHRKSQHRWQRDGSRAGCKDCRCEMYREAR